MSRTAPPDIAALGERLALPPARGRFHEPDLDGLPAPVRRHLRLAIAPGMPRARAARITMRGRLKLGSRWLPFRAREVLAPLAGFVWTARVAGVLSGSDHYVDGEGGLDWRLFGLMPVMQSSGTDVARSAAARGGAEGIWVPTALLPRFGVGWSAEDDTHLTAGYHVDGVDLDVSYTIDRTGRLTAVTFPRWGDPDETGTWSLRPFGIDVTGYGTFGGLAVPAAGRVGWFHGTDRWDEGEFFRYRITRLDPVEHTP
ncbi:MAG: DUF6544 family protein [Acidimicrobiia bacterium]